MTDKVTCRTPNPDRPGTTAVAAWKYEACARALREALEAGGIMGSMELMRAAAERLEANLSPDELEALGSLSWHATTVRLEMEVRSEIERVSDKPVRLRLAG